MNLAKQGNEYKTGKADLFAVLICLRYLLDEDEMRELVIQIGDLLEKLCRSTKRLDENQMRKYMGFPAQWKQIQSCQVKGN